MHVAYREKLLARRFGHSGRAEISFNKRKPHGCFRHSWGFLKASNTTDEEVSHKHEEKESLYAYQQFTVPAHQCATNHPDK